MTLALELAGSFVAGFGCAVALAATLGPWYLKRRMRQMMTSATLVRGSGAGRITKTP